MLEDTDAEARFAAKCDCRFPYRDKAAALALIEEGWALSIDAAFGVLYEICQKPRSARVGRSRQHELVDQWITFGSHPLQDQVVGCARALVEGSKLPWRQAVDVMDEIANYPRQYAALNIAYFSGDCDGDGDAQLAAAHERITVAWT